MEIPCVALPVLIYIYFLRQWLESRWGRMSWNFVSNPSLQTSNAAESTNWRLTLEVIVRGRGAAPRILEPNRVTAARRGRGRLIGARLRGRDGAGQPIEHQEPDLFHDFHKSGTSGHSFHHS